MISWLILIYSLGLTVKFLLLSALFDGNYQRSDWQYPTPSFFSCPSFFLRVTSLSPTPRALCFSLPPFLSSGVSIRWLAPFGVSRIFSVLGGSLKATQIDCLVCDTTERVHCHAKKCNQKLVKKFWYHRQQCTSQRKPGSPAPRDMWGFITIFAVL